jgi:transcriptional regulator with XRE-family HTH domain
VAREDPDRLIRSVGRRIAELRREAGLSQERLAERIGASVQYVSRVELGENLTLTTLAKLGNALGVRAADLLKTPSPESMRANPGRPRKTKA